MAALSAIGRKNARLDAIDSRDEKWGAVRVGALNGRPVAAIALDRKHVAPPTHTGERHDNVGHASESVVLRVNPRAFSSRIYQASGLSHDA